MFGIGPPELIVIFLIVLLLFGGRKIPEIAKGLGRGMREFRKAKDEIQDTLNDDEKEEEEEDEDNEKGESSTTKQSSEEDEEKKTD